MGFLNEDLKSKFENHKNKIQENIDIGKNMGVNKISAILAMDDESEEIQNDALFFLRHKHLHENMFHNILANHTPVYLPGKECF